MHTVLFTEKSSFEEQVKNPITGKMLSSCKLKNPSLHKKVN